MNVPGGMNGDHEAGVQSALGMTSVLPAAPACPSPPANNPEAVLAFLRFAEEHGDRSSILSLKHTVDEQFEIFQGITHVYADLDGTCIPMGGKSFPASLMRKVKLLKEHDTEVTFVTGKPRSEVLSLLATVPKGTPMRILYEKGAYILEQDANGQIVRDERWLLADDPHIERQAATARQAFIQEKARLEQAYGVYIVPAGDGTHESVLSVDVLHTPLPPDHGDVSRDAYKVTNQQILDGIYRDLWAFVRRLKCDWMVTDLHNGNYELCSRKVVKMRAVKRDTAILPGHHPRRVRERKTLLMGDSTNDADWFHEEAPDIYKALVYTSHTPPEFAEETDFATSGEANGELYLDKLIVAKGLRQRIIVVSNTPPYEIRDRQVKSRVGMPVALRDLLEAQDPRHARWVCVAPPAEYAGHDHPLQEQLRFVDIDHQHKESHYVNISNQVFWYLNHDIPIVQFSEEEWERYREVNWRMAEEVKASLGEFHADPENGDGTNIIWVHDFHAIPTAQYLQELRPERDYELGYFWHIPFADPDTWIGRLGEERVREIMTWFSRYSVMGFHTEAYRRNFLATCERVGVPLDATRIIVKPISIDVGEMRDLAQQAEEPGFEFQDERLNQIFGIRDETRAAADYVLCGVERCDPAKNPLERLLAWEILAHRRPDLFLEECEEGGQCKRRVKRKVIEVIVPSRRDIGAYDQLLRDCEATIQRINAHFGMEVIIYLPKIEARGDTAAALAKSRLVVITSKRDGYNMVAKEKATIMALQHWGRLLVSRNIGCYQSFLDMGMGDAIDTFDDLTPQAMADKLEDVLSQPLAAPGADYVALQDYDEVHNLDSWTETYIEGTRCQLFARGILVPETRMAV